MVTLRSEKEEISQGGEGGAGGAPGAGAKIPLQAVVRPW